MSTGIFKGTYSGDGIYWQGTYNVDGSGSFATMAETRAYIDKLHAQRKERDIEQARLKIEAGAIRLQRLNLETARVYFPSGAQDLPMRKVRQSVFDWEDQYKAECVWLD